MVFYSISLALLVLMGHKWWELRGERENKRGGGGQNKTLFQQSELAIYGMSNFSLSQTAFKNATC